MKEPVAGYDSGAIRNSFREGFAFVPILAMMYEHVHLGCKFLCFPLPVIDNGGWADDQKRPRFSMFPCIGHKGQGLDGFPQAHVIR